MNHQEIRILMTQTISPDTEKRKKAEDALGELEKNATFIMTLPDSYMKDSDPIVKKVSTIFFKNCVERNWDKEFFRMAKQYLMENIVSLMVKSEESVINYYLNIVQFIFQNEKPENLEALFNDLQKCILSQEVIHNYVGISLFNLVQDDDNLRYNTKFVHPIVNHLSQCIYERLIFYLENRNFMMARLYMKFLAKFSRQYQTPKFYSDFNFYSALFNLCKKILILPEVDDIEILRLIKWSLRFITKGTEKALRNYHKKTEINEFVISESNIKEVYHSCKMIIHNHVAQNVEYEKTISAALEYVITITCSKNFTPIVLDDLYFFLNTLVIQKFTFGDKEELDYEFPDTFLREKHSFYVSNLKNLTGNFLDEVTKKLIKRKEEFQSYLDYLKTVICNFINSPSETNARMAYAALHMVAMSSSWIAEFLQQDTFLFLKDYVFPFLTYKLNWLKGQACYVLQFFSGEEFRDESIKIAFDLICSMLLTEDDILKVDALQSISFFFYNDMLKNDFKEKIPQILRELISLNNKYDLESLAETSEQLISNYASEVAQYGPSLVQGLTEIVKNIISTDPKDKIDVISGHLRTIETLFSSITHKEILIPMFQHCIPLIIYILENKCEDFYQETIDILSSFTYNLKLVDQTMWGIFYKILSLDKNSLYNNVCEISNLIELFILFGGNHIFNQNYFNKVISFVQSICCSSLDDFFQDDYNCGCRIIEYLILSSDNYLVENIDAFISIVLRNKGFFEKDSSCWVYCLNVIMHCYAMNQTYTENALHKHNFFIEFLNKVYEKRRLFKRVHDKKTVLLFIGILSSRPEIQFNYVRLAKALISSLKSLPNAIIKRNTLLSKKDEMTEDDYLSNEDEMLEEDVYFETKLDKFDAFDFIKQVFNSIQPNTIGYNILTHLDKDQKEIIQNVLSNEQPKQI